MPLQNRVTPTGQIVATSARGTLMGNRGCLHDEHGRIVRRHTTKSWITCALEFRGRRRPLMEPGKYTVLFFIDEATALAAGHRPCAECRNQQYKAYLSACSTNNPDLPAGVRPSAKVLDHLIHAERTGPRGSAMLSDLPGGTFVLLSDTDTPHLLHEDRLYPWTPEGYQPPIPATSQRVTVLTPSNTRHTLRNGYEPGLHASIPRL